MIKKRTTIGKLNALERNVSDLNYMCIVDRIAIMSYLEAKGIVNRAEYVKHVDEAIRIVNQSSERAEFERIMKDFKTKEK